MIVACGRDCLENSTDRDERISIRGRRMSSLMLQTLKNVSAFLAQLYEMDSLNSNNFKKIYSMEM